jgi:hypothetical protein
MNNAKKYHSLEEKWAKTEVNNETYWFGNEGVLIITNQVKGLNKL